jgi:hypothetical protein
MSTNPPTASGDTSARAVKERLVRLEQDLIRQRQRLNSTTTLTGIVGIIALLAVAGYSWYGYREISLFTNPEKVVDLGQQMLDDNLPELRRKLELEIVESAPQWASTLSKEALGSLPAGRKQLEKMAMENMDDALSQTRSITKEHFRSFLDKNKDHLKKNFEELAKSPDLAETTLADLQKDLQEDLGVDFQADAAALLKEITIANKAFKKLREGKDLNQQEQLERRNWMLARAVFRQERLDLSTTGLPEISANGQTTPTAGQIPVAGDGRSAKPTKRAPVPTTQEDNKKDAIKADPKKDSTPEAGKKDADKKKEDSEKKKD